MEHAILLVEDNPDLAAALSMFLEHEGHDVVHTPSGLDAIMRVAQNDFDLVLLDQQVEDLAGGAVLRVLSDLAVRAPVFAMSAQASGWQADAFRHGATACLRKPFNARRLVELIEALHQSNTRDTVPGDVRQLSTGDLSRLARMSREDLDSLPFGAIRLDADRRIDCFNSFEGTASTFFPPSVIGARFSDIAPCSAVKEFAEAIEQGYATGAVDTVLRFVFPHHGARAIVSVRVYTERATERLWIFVSKARGDVTIPLSAGALGDSLPTNDR